MERLGSSFLLLWSSSIVKFFFGQDRKVHLNEWDGKTLKETVVLEGNKNIVSALAFSPDGKLLASGDVNFDFQLLLLSWRLTMAFLNLVFRKNHFIRCERKKGK